MMEYRYYLSLHYSILQETVLRHDRLRSIARMSQPRAKLKILENHFHHYTVVHNPHLKLRATCSDGPMLLGR